MNIGIIGAGRLGLCLALNLDKKGHSVVAYDINGQLVRDINDRTYKTSEPFVEQYLASSKIIASTDIGIVGNTDIIFIVLPTPSNPDGSYDHTLITDTLKLLKTIDIKDAIIVINSTVMPGYCSSVASLAAPNLLCYNPEFIAQGSIINDQQNQDIILIGGPSTDAMLTIAALHMSMCVNKPLIKIMSLVEAEIAKLATNVFLTMKIAYANKIGDMVLQHGGDPETVLDAIGSDKRINKRFLKYGFGYGGPCLPRDNEAFIKAASAVNISTELNKAVDAANQSHLQYLVEDAKGLTSLAMGRVTFKDESTIIEKSQRLAYAEALADAGTKITIYERQEVIDILSRIYGNKFTYAVEN